jgi:molybdopterin-guanine dinucleotide biosynthesis protein A
MSFCHDGTVPIDDVAAAILAGGRARRFGGRDKSRLIVEGRAIIVRQIEVLQRVAHPIFVVANEADRFADLALTVHADLMPGTGALGGVYTALVHSPASRVIVVACDMPFLDPRVLERLVELTSSFDAAWVRTARGVEPLLACYRKSAAAVLRQELDASRLRAGDVANVISIAELDESELSRIGSVDRILTNPISGRIERTR